MELAESQRAVENREKWRKLVAKSSVVPHDPRGEGIDDDDDGDIVVAMQLSQQRQNNRLQAQCHPSPLLQT